MKGPFLKQGIAQHLHQFSEFLLMQWHTLTTRDSNRVTGGTLFSVIIHLIVVVIFLCLSQNEKMTELPIREITFMDITDKIKIENHLKSINKYSDQKEKAVASPKPVPAKSEAKQPASKPDIKANWRKRFYSDMQRKQAPVSIERHAPVSLSKSKDFIKISSVKGTHNKRILIPAPINLNQNKKIKLVSKKVRPLGYRIDRSKKPEITFTKIKPSLKVKASGISLLSSAKPIDIGKPSKDLKQTATYISGPLANRPLLKRNVPPFPLWARRKGVGATISLRFTVMENGRVKENIIIERTSGSFEWDQMVISSLKNWIFTALENKETRHDQTGVITFQFVI